MEIYIDVHGTVKLSYLYKRRRKPTDREQTNNNTNRSSISTSHDSVC